MKNWIRIILILFVLIGGTVFFGHWAINQFDSIFDDTLDNLSASYIANTPRVSLYDNTNKEQISTTTPGNISTETVSTLATSTDLEPSLIFPKENNQVYIGCTYQISWQSSNVINSLETALIDGGTREAAGPVASGLAKKNKIEPDYQNLDWKVGVVWPGEYFILASKINDVEIETKSKFFMIDWIPKDISASEQENFCKESGGLV